MTSFLKGLRAYFSAVWIPITPYLGLYCLGWAFSFPVSWLLTLFHVLHLINLTFVTVFLVTERREGRGGDLLFWGALFLFFLLPGAYLEYPADVWEHFRRALSWQGLELVSDNEADIKRRFAYFFNWSLISYLPMEARRTGLSVISALWQFLLALQFFLFLGSLKFGRKAQWVGVLSWLCFFGTGLFGIRYYSLSSTPLAMIGLFGGLVCVQSAFKHGWKELLPLAILFLLMELNHPKQEIAGFLIGATALVMGECWIRAEATTRTRYIKFCFVFVIFCVLGARLLSLWGPPVYQSFRFNYAIDVWGGPYFARDRLGILSTLGVNGLLGLVSAGFLFSRHPKLSFLCIAPVFAVLFPPSFQLISLLAGPEASLYRILFAFPTSVALGIGLYEFLISKIGAKGFTLALIGIAGLGFVYINPFYGRLFFQLYRPQTSNTLRALDTTAAWFAKNRTEKILGADCKLVTDEVTNFLLMTQTKLPFNGISRVNPNRELIYIWNSRDPILGKRRILFHLFHSNACGVLLAQPKKLPEFSSSFIGKLSGHWIPNSADIRSYLPEEFEEFQNIFKQANWTATDVPPYYVYWEPPPGYTPYRY